MKSKKNTTFAKNNYMLLRCNVEEWAGFPQRVRESLLSTRRMSRITARPGNKSRIYYSYPDGHRRGNLHPLIIDATPSEINTASELPLFNDFCEFEVYENDRLDGTTYIMNIKAADILRITAYDNDHCFLYVHHNEVDVSRYLVRYGLESIYNILIGGSTTTGEDFDWSSYWTTLTSGLLVYRKGERSGMYVIDKSEDGGTTWELNLIQLEIDEDSIIISIDDGVDGYRHVIRDDAYCIDHELDATGFDGTEGVNWENIYNTNTL